MIKEYEGDLLTAQVAVIAHQCNTVTKGVSGLAAAVYKQYPEANLQADRNPDPRMYGMIDFVSVGTVPAKPHIYVANLYAQLLPGRPTYGLDSAQGRLDAFRSCLDNLHSAMHQVGVRSVAFPARIGSDMAGGDWTRYRELIRKFGCSCTGCDPRQVRANHPLDVHIVELKR